MILVSMRVSKHLGPTMSMCFQIPTDHAFDLKDAWLRNCDLELFNNVVKPCDMSISALCLNGKRFISSVEGKRLGIVTIEPFTIHDASVKSSYEIEFKLESGLRWDDIFKCGITDLYDRMREKLVHMKNEPFQEAFGLVKQSYVCYLNLGEFSILELEYAGVPVGRLKIRKIS